MPQISRMTRQRRVILDELARTKAHPTAFEVFELVRRRLPHISLATVYRNLVCLADAGQIIRIASTGKEWHYDGNTDPHLHFVCECCGRVSDLPLDYSPSLDVPAHQDGYQVMGFRLEFFGLCPACPEMPNPDSVREYA